MGKSPYSDNDRREFLREVSVCRGQGFGVKAAFEQARLTWRRKGLRAPSLQCFYNWLRAEREADPQPQEAPAVVVADPEPETQAVPVAAGDPQYTSTLEDIVRLYRRRAETDVDAIVDRVVPDLINWEEE